MSAIRVAVIAEVRLYREGLVDILRQERIAVSGSAGDARGGIDLVRLTRPQIALVDMSMRDAEAALGPLRRASPETRIVALGILETEARVVACVEAGVAGYVAMDGSLTDLLETMDRVSRGEVVCPPRIAGSLFRRVGTLSLERRPALGVTQLTARELEVVELIDQGFTNKEIARQLGIEFSTVKNHVHNILEKLEVRRRSQAAAWVRRVPGHAPRDVL